MPRSNMHGSIHALSHMLSRQSAYLVKNRDNISFIKMETREMCNEIIPKQWKNILRKGNTIYH
jgi:hypothetical protein